MVKFRNTMDEHAVDVLRGEALVASLQWHPGREPRLVVQPSGVHFPEFTISELRAMKEELSKRIAEWVRVETDKAMRPVLAAFGESAVVTLAQSDAVTVISYGSGGGGGGSDPGEKRWPVQGERYANQLMAKARPKKPAGTVGDAEARVAYATYAAKYGNEQTFERVHARGGFGYWELTDLLGHEPTTWRADQL